MSILAVSGSSTIFGSLKNLLPPREVVEQVSRPWDLPIEADRFLILNGFLSGKSTLDQSQQERTDTWEANYAQVVRAVDRILSANPVARICVIGSESAISGSFDTGYADAKAALHQFVETTKTGPRQQLVAIAPTIIEDSGMTSRRADQDRVAERARTHPKQRHLISSEVARLVYFLLYVDRGYLTGTVVRMNGGSHTWR